MDPLFILKPTLPKATTRANSKTHKAKFAINTRNIFHMYYFLTIVSFSDEATVESLQAYLTLMYAKLILY